MFILTAISIIALLVICFCLSLDIKALEKELDNINSILLARKNTSDDNKEAIKQNADKIEALKKYLNGEFIEEKSIVQKPIYTCLMVRIPGEDYIKTTLVFKKYKQGKK